MKTQQKKSMLNASGYGRLNMFPANKAWNADGDGNSTTDTGSTSATAATNQVVTKPKCNKCRNKKIACVGAGILIGVVVTLLLTKSGGAKAA